MNAFSSSDVDVNLEKILEACQNYSDHLDDYGNTVCKRLATKIKLGAQIYFTFH